MSETEDNQKKERRGVRSISLSIPDDAYKRLLIKIRHENLNWKRFFNMMIQGFLNDEPAIMEYIDFQMSEIRAKRRTKILQKERVKVQETIDVFGLDKDDIENIYDILEEEFDP